MAELKNLFKTYSKKAGEVEHKWVLVDVAGMPLGRAASFIAQRLSGKYQPSFTTHMDSGDFVVVINADQLEFKGDERAKKYYRHSGFPGSIKEKTARETSLSEMLERAVKGMLPKNKLQAPRLARLKVYAGTEHNHAAQKPVEVKPPQFVTPKGDK
jgi:large subunit ribosomal protein L13